MRAAKAAGAKRARKTQAARGKATRPKGVKAAAKRTTRRAARPTTPPALERERRVLPQEQTGAAPAVGSAAPVTSEDANAKWGAAETEKAGGRLSFDADENEG
jgi:hypothetical protein